MRAAASVVVALAPVPASVDAQPREPAAACEVLDGGTCDHDAGRGADRAPIAPRAPGDARVRLTFYWGVGCPHCEQARVVLASLTRAGSGVALESVEVRQSPAGLARMQAEVARLGIAGAGIPLFVVGDRFVVGYRPGASDAELRALCEALEPSAPARKVTLPIVGELDPATIPLPLLTLVIGLVDGINPCAMYVLVVMLGILLHVRERRRLVLFGGTFVVMSGVVYFLFMTAWLGVFTLAGLSRWVTMGLGLVLVVMGTLNLKELVWFKRGPSLMIPDRAKPGIFRRMREIARAASLPAALVGIAALAFVVNLIELGCTLGLPAVFTRVLALRGELSGAARFGYLALYNVAYVVPLALIVGVYALTLHRLTLTERGAKALKAVSGALLVSFGLLFVLAPQILE